VVEYVRANSPATLGIECKQRWGLEAELVDSAQEVQDGYKEIAQTPWVLGVNAQNANAVGFQCSNHDNAVSPIAVR
jgi:hypothetical protein